jgi:hypothetical protein
MKAQLTITISEDGVQMVAVDSEGIATWNGFYSSKNYTDREMSGRVLRDVPQWIIKNINTEEA